MQPRIGISMNCGSGPDGGRRVYLDQPYLDYVQAAGALPVPLPPMTGRGMLEQTLRHVDAVMLTGGNDPDPARWGAPVHPRTVLLDPQREAAEALLYETARRQGRPILAICLGIQLINVCHGGSLHQHLPDVGGMLTHQVPGGRAEHDIVLRDGGALAEWLGVTRAVVNSYHHQGIARLGAGLRAAAHTADGLVEAVTAADGAFLAAVQWHPEREPDTAVSRALMRAFLAAVR